MFFIQTGNHHLFLILHSQSGEEWVVLLGKRKLHFPFFGVRFENATFYNIHANRLYHCAADEMPDLQFQLGDHWKISGKTPFPFSLCLKPTDLKNRRHFLGRVIFNYHLLDLENGNINGRAIVDGKGFSEYGTLHILKKFRTLFDYLLLLERNGKDGLLQWKSTLPFLKDRFFWGVAPPQAPPETLASTNIPLKNWTLHREIVRVAADRNKIWYGLREHFEQADRKI